MEPLSLGLQLPCVDNDNQAENCSHNALYIHEQLAKGRSVAIPLLVGDFTRFLISFIPLWEAIPHNTFYPDGSGGGVQINIDRVGSYALGRGHIIRELSYLQEKWGVTKGDAKFLLFFFNTVISGKDQFKTYSQDVMHKLLSNKKPMNKQTESERG